MELVELVFECLILGRVAAHKKCTQQCARYSITDYKSRKHYLKINRDGKLDQGKYLDSALGSQSQVPSGADKKRNYRICERVLGVPVHKIL